MLRPLSPLVLSSPACAEFRRLYEEARNERASRWAQVADRYEAAMHGFDRLLTSGQASQADNQNGKGDFFGDLVCLLLSNCSGRALGSRPSVAGRVFDKHNLDAAYPASGEVALFIETKVVGTPKTDRNRSSQKNPLGRAGSSDMDKRVKECSLKTIDLKAELSRQQGVGQGPAGDLIQWISESRPLCFVLFVARVVNQRDLDRVVRLSNAAASLSNGCGLWVYSPPGVSLRTPTVPRQLQMDIMLTRICEQLKALPTAAKDDSLGTTGGGVSQT